MHALAEYDAPLSAEPDPRVAEIAEILAVRRRMLEDPDARYLPVLALLLIDHEIPRLIEILAPEIGAAAQRGQR